VDVFDRVLGADYPQVIVSRYDLRKQIRHVAQDRGRVTQTGPGVNLRHERPALDRAYVAPDNETESVLVELWEACLGISGIGIYDNFLELGGHSLLATQVASRIRERLGSLVPLRLFFEMGTIRDIADFIHTAPVGEDVPAEAPEIKKLRERGGTVDTIRPVPRDGLLPLSFGQERLWALDRIDGGSAQYNEFSAYRLEGRLCVQALEQALAAMVRRHEILRTTFTEVEGIPYQKIGTAFAVAIPVVDVSAREDRELVIGQMAGQDAMAAFDLGVGPLFRVKLLKTGAESHVLLQTMHHIICDAWSSGIFVRELAWLYEKAAGGQQDVAEERWLPPLPIQYADFAVWQRGRLAGRRLEEGIEFWTRKLAGAPQVLNLPFDKPRPPVQTPYGHRVVMQMDDLLAGEVKALAHRTGVTCFVMFQAAFHVLLSRHSGQEDFLIGTPVAQRDRLELENLAGFFVNTLVLRGNLTGNPTFGELLGRVRESTLESFAHSEIPFEKLVEVMRPERDMSRHPLFQTLFAYQNTLPVAVSVEGLRIDRLEVETVPAKFDLAFIVEESASGFSFVMEYNTDLFEDGTIRCLGERYMALLKGITGADGLHCRASELPVMLESERRKVVETWNATGRDYDLSGRLHDAFEQRAAENPEAVALVFRGERLSYGALNRRANQLAWYLKGRGIGRDMLVGVCMERSIELVVALYAILKAGGCYVPLDPDYPDDRLRFMLEDSGVGFVLTQERLKGKLEGNTSGALIGVDSAWGTIAAYGEDNPGVQASGADLAYMIYTSGSTGQPKGALNTHRGIINRLLWMQDEYGLKADEAVLQKTPFSFDVSVWEFFWPLMTGARLVMAEPGGHRDSAYLRGVIEAEGITTIHFVPPMLQLFLEDLGVGACGSLRRVICSGEALSEELRVHFLEKLDCELHNLYGPTEAAVDVTFRDCREGHARGVVPIGRPIANTQIYILDPWLHPVPVGVAGELHIGGVNVGRGYHNRPELTREKFIANPFLTGGLLYKTGDLARHLEDGNIEYLGRMDHQVKIRGFRVELGEIEACLRNYAGVRDAVVTVRGDGVLKHLAGYVVAGDDVDTHAVKVYLRDKLPEHMVPGSITKLGAFPLSPNGKIDRRALPAPESGASDPDDAGPITPVEEMMCGVWCDVLQMDQVGLHDDFFEIGGHSLLATRVCSRIRDVFGVELPVRNLFTFSTIATLCGELEKMQGRGVLPPSDVMVRGSVSALSFGQERLWFLDQYEDQKSLYNIPVALRLQGSFDPVALEWSLNEVIRHHENLRTVFPSSGGRPVASILPALVLRVPVVTLRSQDDSEQTAELSVHLREMARLPFDLAEGPLLRVAILRRCDEDHVLAMVMHHMIGDGWSMGVLTREITALYGSFMAGDKNGRLPDLPVQYADFAAWQKQRLSGARLAEQAEYWKRQLAGAPPALNLPGDRSRPPVQTYNGCMAQFVIDARLTSQLRKVSRSSGVTLFMTLLGAYAVWLARITGQEDLVIGTPIAGRTRKEVEPLIGLFVNTLALRLHLSGQPSFREFLRGVREVTLEAYAHQDMPFEKIVEMLQPERDVSRTPVFQTVFGLQNTPFEAIGLPGVAVTPMAMDNGTAKFDFMLLMEEHGETLTGYIEYNTDIFDHSTVLGLAERFKLLLGCIADKPESGLADLAIMRVDELERVLETWSGVRTEYPRNRSIDQLFEEQVQRTPEAPAVQFVDRVLTYGELNARANRLAHHLRSLGVGPDVLVGVFMERSLEMITALLGILKAGGAYVPLDPDYPAERIAFMLADTGLQVLLTQAKLSGRLPSLTGGNGSAVAEVICLDRAGDKLASYPTEDLPPVAGPEDLAYVMYTSGSTGQPKGSSIPQRAVVRLVKHTNFMTFGRDDIFLQYAPVSFDAATLEIWGPLLNGGKLVLLPPGNLSLAELGAAIRGYKVTSLWLTSSLFNLMVDEQMADLAGVRQLLSGGDVLSVRHVRKALAGLPGCRLINGYGPTENTTFTCCHTITSQEEDQSVPIGRPIANTQVYVLDPWLHPVPVGVAGELYIGGDGLARDYYKRPELTAQRFVEVSPGAGISARLYRTGDRVRYRPDGNIEFLGRLDEQVKIRGFRIEPGEIETALGRHPAVRDGVVVAKTDAVGSKRLVAYVVAHAGTEVPAEDVLRDFLKELLPDYMVPAVFVVMEQLPLSPNGKVDRKALPDPDFAKTGGREYVAPQTESEKQLAEILGLLLGREQVGVHDNFFEIGGHSLLATQAISRISGAFGVQVPLRSLFDKPTIAALAAHVDETKRVLREVQAPVRQGMEGREEIEI
jgi:amino acid adenylation domain-containing protein